MSTRKIASIAAATLLATVATSACGDDATKKDDPLVCPEDFSRFSAGDPVSLRNDLMPLFAISCDSSACHDLDKPYAGLVLDVGEDNVASDDEANAVHSSLMEDSATAPSTKRVAPGDPANSFLLHKLAGCQDDVGLSDCSSLTNIGGPCGQHMPSVGTGSWRDTAPEKYELVVRWVMQGAPNN